MTIAVNMEIVYEAETNYSHATDPGAYLLSNGQIILGKQTLKGSNAVCEFFGSSDYGKTWSVRSELPNAAIDEECRMAHLPGNVLLFPTIDDSQKTPAIYRSVDGAYSWTKVVEWNAAALTNKAYRVQSVTSYGRGSAIAYGWLAHAVNEGYNSMIARSTDAGATWTTEPGNVVGSFVSLPSMIAQAPGALLAAGQRVGLYTSTDDGASWSGPASLPDPPNRFLKFIACARCLSDDIWMCGGNYNKIVAGNYQPAVWRTTNAGSTWSLLTAGNIQNWNNNTGQNTCQEIHRVEKNFAMMALTYRLEVARGPWSYSIDQGANWLEPNTSGTDWSLIRVQAAGAMCTAPDGGIISTLSALTFPGATFQIWKTKVTGA